MPAIYLRNISALCHNSSAFTNPFKMKKAFHFERKFSLPIVILGYGLAVNMRIGEE
jgi:hypothetical protein